MRSKINSQFSQHTFSNVKFGSFNINNNYSNNKDNIEEDFDSI